MSRPHGGDFAGPVDLMCDIGVVQNILGPSTSAKGLYAPMPAPFSVMCA